MAYSSMSKGSGGSGPTHFQKGEITVSTTGTTVTLDFTPKCVVFISSAYSSSNVPYMALTIMSDIDETVRDEEYKDPRTGSTSYSSRSIISEIIPNGFIAKAASATWATKAYYVAVG